MPLWLKLTLCLAAWSAAAAATTAAMRRLHGRRHPLAATLRAVRNLLLPLLLVLLVWLAIDPEPLPPSGADGDTAAATWFRVLETVLWLAGIVVALSLVKNTAFTQRDGAQYQTRMPKLFLDILRLILVVVGALLVFKGVWGTDISAAVTALGVSSIVLGLALQNTLDNVMAGIAVLFERPFEVGDWIRVGDTHSQVLEMNWRAVRVRTRAQDQIVLPNSVIGKETLINYSRPTRVHGETHVLGFSYDDPPNKVKRILHQVALSTRGVLAAPAPAVRTVKYADWSIEYQVRFFLDDYDRLQDINDEFMTKVWYAAKRNRLTIPFPIQTSYEHHVRMPPPPPPAFGRAAEALGRVPVFVPLGPDELDELSRSAVRQDYGRGERVVHQGDAGDSMYLIQDGTAVVSVRDEHGGEREVARLSRGEFFGEMAVLTGEARTANVTAADDLAVLVLHKEALSAMLQRRPALAQEMAEIMTARRQGLRAIQDMQVAPPEVRQRIHSGAAELLKNIRRFFGL